MPRMTAPPSAKRDQRRLLSLQAEFALRGFVLEQLSGSGLIVRRWGLFRVFDSLDEAQRYLDQVGGAR